MKSYFKKMICLTILFVLCIFFVADASVDLTTFNLKLSAFKTEKYSHGSTYQDNPDLTGGYTCFGFANEVALYIWGSYPTNSMSAASVNSGWSVAYGGSAVDNLCVGDIVRYHYHSIFITGISGDTIYYCQANTPSGTNKVTYENTVSKSKLKSKVSDKLTSPGTTKTGWVAHYTGGLSPSTPSDIEQPTISNLRAENVTGDSFTIKCDLNDNVGVTRVWLNVYGPGGSNGYSVSASNGSFSHEIKTSDYGGSGLYSVHVYAFDAAGNESMSSLSDINTIGDAESPVICNLYTSNVSSNSFTINCDVYDNVAVTRAWIIVWGPGGNSGNGYSISVFNNFSHTINTADYGGRGEYTVHVYVYDDNGNEAVAALNDIMAVSDAQAPVICQIRPTNVNSQSFTINCDVYDNAAVTRAWIVVWGPGGNSGNGYSLSVFNNFSHTINTSDYGGAGWYSVHIYVYDDDGNETGGALNNIYIADDYTAPEITKLTVTNISDSSFTINCTANEQIVRAWINIYGPSKSDGYALTMYNNSFKHTIDTINYGGAGNYEVHVYVWDVNGNESLGCSTGQFAANKIYTVNFNANQGTTLQSSMIVTYNSTYGTLPTPARTGYTFKGWYTSASGGTQITGSTKVTITSAQTLYAQWTANVYTVTFNANGGTTPAVSKNVTCDSTYGTLPTPTRTGYIFKGWYTAADGGTQIISDTKVVGTSNQTLYAQWAAVPVTGITVSESSVTLTVDDTKQLTAAILPDNAANKIIIWTTSDETVAIVDGNGLIKAIAPGNAEITSTTADGGYTAVCEVTVQPKPVEIIAFDASVMGVYALVNMSVVNAPDTAIAYIAAYGRDDKLASVQNVAVSSAGTQTIIPITDVAYIKAFVWNAENARPLAGIRRINIE